MTEDEAKTKWCPHARDDGSNRFRFATAAEMREDGLSADYPAEMAASYPCIASACMAWRVIPPASLERAKLHAEASEWIPAIKALREVCRELTLLQAKEIVQGNRPWPTDDWHGYCGLAGAPQ